MAIDRRSGPAPPVLELPRVQREHILDHAVRVYPEECCGFLVGRILPEGKQVLRVVPASNHHPSAPRRAYRLAPESYLAADRAARRDGLEIVGFYHSHPEGSAAPSDADLRSALPEVSYVIVSVGRNRPAAIASWTLGRRDRQFNPETLRERPEEVAS